ncbi:glycosyltransferase [Bacillus sp. ISL-47]|uniref:glycosyltransferase n=1 Tax=Bacillus sp. ISL-47 TaxID=2819130 RepID=UPI001BE6287B|nr:glycosyltransferase [Bacillus sp. ISL-47]MBT2686889.1 glycosyltransferase [Bacillus sp. ISL-47]MBT2710428.1 glycosyltransferase [Pseudomonas sp. ISL-84]
MNTRGLVFNGQKKIEFKSIFLDVKNNFTYEFWVKPRSYIKLPPQTNSGIYGIRRQQWAIGAGYGGSDEDKAGVGVSVGLNGIVIFEHAQNHFPATLVYRSNISKWTHVAIVFIDKTPHLYINGIFVKKGFKSKMKNLYPSGILGAQEDYGFFRGYLNDIKIWEYERTSQQIAATLNSVDDNEKGLYFYLKLSILNQLEQKGSYFKNDIDTKKKISFPKLKNSCLVSIIIPVYNNWEFTKKCLNSIFENTTNLDYEIIIADDMSTDTTKEIQNFFENIKVIRDGINRGFLKNCNNATKYAKGKYLLFLNNDTTVHPNWLGHLVRLIESDEKIGMVGAKLIHSDGSLQEAGSIIFNDGSCYGYGRGDHPDNPQYSFVREVHYCSGACIMVKKNLFTLAGKFDEQFAPAYYEEVDLAMKLRELGYKIMFQPLAVIHHHEFGSSSSKKAIELQMKNKEKFYKKWKRRLEEFQVPHIKNVLKARNFKAKQFKLLVVDDRIPAPELGSGLPRTFSLLNCLAEIGVQVTYFPLTNSERTEPCTRLLQEKGIEVMYSTETKKLDFQNFYLKRSDFFDAIWISRPHNLKRIYNIIKSNNKNQKIIYDAEALFAQREILRIESLGRHLSNRKKEYMLQEEIQLINKADLIVTVSMHEKEKIQNYIQKPIFVLGHPVEKNKTENPFENRKDILFVGGFLSSPSPNEDAIIHFIKNIYPKVFSKLKAKLWIVGTNNSEAIKGLSSKNVIVTGQVDNLSYYYDKCKVFIIPTRYAAGIPLKALEAMSHGLPSIVTPLISKQLGLDENYVLIGKNSEEFAQKLINLYEDKKLWTKLRNNGITHVADHFNKKIFKEKLIDILSKENSE